MKVQIDGVDLWFDVDGASVVASGDRMSQRPTVVTLHGGPGFDHSFYKPEMQSLADHTQVVFFDQRGQGRSDAGDPADWRIDRWADDVASFCKALDIRRPILIGQSFGGFVALATAVRHPELASGLIVLSSSAYVERETVIARFRELGGEEAADAARSLFEHPEDEAIVGRFIQLCFPLYARKNVELLMAKLGRAIMRPEPQQRFFRPDGEFGAFDYREGLRDCRTPTLMLHGELDPIIPIAFARDTAACFPPGVARLVTYDDAAHDLLGDRWEDVHAAMVGFIGQLDSTAISL